MPPFSLVISRNSARLVFFLLSRLQVPVSVIAAWVWAVCRGALHMYQGYVPTSKPCVWSVDFCCCCSACWAHPLSPFRFPVSGQGGRKSQETRETWARNSPAPRYSIVPIVPTASCFLGRTLDTYLCPPLPLFPSFLLFASREYKKLTSPSHGYLQPNL